MACTTDARGVVGPRLGWGAPGGAHPVPGGSSGGAQASRTISTAFGPVHGPGVPIGNVMRAIVPRAASELTLMAPS